MSLVQLDNVSIAFGHVLLLDEISLRIEKQERVCLIGRNGEGKSTLLQIISGELVPDHGRVEWQSGCRIARLTQQPAFKEQDTVFHLVAQSLGNIGKLVNEYHDLTVKLAQHNDQSLINQLENIQHQLEAQDGWRLEQRIETILSRLQLPPDEKLSELSGGWQRRVALAQALVVTPDLLLLDEPTNHLDIEAITWLEDLLLEFNGGLLFVSHDRSFMQRVATRIVELDRGHLTQYPNDYNTYSRIKEENLAVETSHAAKFDKRLAQEEAWIRQGIKARRTRNEGRVRALKKMREERARRREQMGRIRAVLDTGELSGRTVIEAEKISKYFGNTPIIKNLSTIIMRGDKVGVMGPNGVGKTTLLKILLGELSPDSGTIKLGTHLNVAYFDQLRAQLDLEHTVVDMVGQGRDFVTINGQKKHVMSYLADFLFPTARARSPVKSLSGGERNRLLLACLFTKPANLLVLDEPTNDLDVESLELLEELLVNYPGTLLLVTHDRSFLDNVVTSTLVFEGCGQVTEYVGGYQEWLRQRPTVEVKETKPNSPRKTATIKSEPIVLPGKARKLSYKEQQELAKLPHQIELLEIELESLHTLINSPNFYKGEQKEINAHLVKVKEIEAELAILYQRWEELDS